MIYSLLLTLILAGIKDVLVVTTWDWRPLDGLFDAQRLVVKLLWASGIVIDVL